MSGSIGPELRRAVTDGLAAHLRLLGDFNGTTAPERSVEVTYGFDFASEAAEQVYTGRSRAETPPAAMKAGRNHRDELGEFDLNVRVRFLGGTPEDADVRAFAIGAECEEWLADRKSNELGVSGLLSLLVAGWESDYVGIDSGAATVITYRVRWRARLT